MASTTNSAAYLTAEICGKYNLRSDAHAIAELFGIENLPALLSHYNIVDLECIEPINLE